MFGEKTPLSLSLGLGVRVVCGVRVRVRYLCLFDQSEMFFKNDWPIRKLRAPFISHLLPGWPFVE